MTSPVDPHLLDDVPSSPPSLQIDEKLHSKTNSRKGGAAMKRVDSHGSRASTAESIPADERSSGRKSPPFKRVSGKSLEPDSVLGSASKMTSLGHERPEGKKKHSRQKSSDDAAVTRSKVEEFSLAGGVEIPAIDLLLGSGAGSGNVSSQKKEKRRSIGRASGEGVGHKGGASGEQPLQQASTGGSKKQKTPRGSKAAKSPRHETSPPDHGSTSSSSMSASTTTPVPLYAFGATRTAIQDVAEESETSATPPEPPNLHSSERRHSISESPKALTSPMPSHLQPASAPHTPLVGSKNAKISAPVPFLQARRDAPGSTPAISTRLGPTVAPTSATTHTNLQHHPVLQQQPPLANLGTKQPPLPGSKQPPLPGSKQPPLPGSKQPPLTGSKQAPPLPGSKSALLPVSASGVATGATLVGAPSSTLASFSSSSSGAPLGSNPHARIHSQPAPSLAKLPPMGSRSLLPSAGPLAPPPSALTVRSGSGVEFTQDHNLSLSTPPGSPERSRGSNMRLPSGPSAVMPTVVSMPGPPPMLPGSASFSGALPAAPAPAVDVPAAFEASNRSPDDDTNTSSDSDFVDGLRVVFNNRGYTDFPRRILDTNGVVAILGGHNELSELPSALASKTAITRLDFPSNQFKEIPLVVFDLPNLRHLDFSKNKISLIPAGITSVTSLTTLILQANRLKAFPNHICVLSRLEHLDLSGHKFKMLPPQLGNLNNLKVLKLAQCEIEALPIEIGKLTHLSTLKLHHNGLSKLPAEMAALSALQVLDLGNNLFSNTPVNLFYIDSLTDLNLEENTITKIDESILRLVNLTRLNVASNQLHSLPAEIAALTSLSTLNATGNPLSSIPAEFQNGDALLEHLRWLKLQSSWRRRKLVFVGEEFVGKTSLRMSLINSYSTKATRRKRKNRGTQLQVTALGSTTTAEIADPVATDGIDIEDWEPIGTDEDGLEPIVFSTWDFAGQQIYHPTHQFFITGRSTYLIIFNLLDQRTSRIEYWLKTLKARTEGKCPVVIVGTHRDDKRCDAKYVDAMFASMRKKYSTRFPFVREYVAVSSKTGRGLDRLTEVLVDLARASRYFKNIPESYAKLEKQILQIRTTANTMSISEFEGVAMSAGVEKSDVPSCVSFLHDVGLLVYFNDKSSGLSDLVILDPLWIVNLLSSIITLKHGFVKDGIMMANCLPQIWKEYPPSEYTWLLKLLDKFEITFRIAPSTAVTDTSQGVRNRWIRMLMHEEAPKDTTATGSSRNLTNLNSLDLLVIPSMLPATPADMHLNELWNNDSEFESYVYGRRYIFQFLPLGFFSRLIVRTLHMAGLTPQLVWRDGMIIDSDNERAMLVHNELDYLLDIVIKTKKRQRSPSVIAMGTEPISKKIMAASFNVLRQLADCIETLLVSWFKLKPIVRVPCHHCLYEKLFENPEATPYYFPIEECMLAVREGKESLVCHAEKKPRKRPVNVNTRGSVKHKDSIGGLESTSLPSLFTPPLSARSTPGSPSLGLEVGETAEHVCMIRDLCSDIAFSDVSDMTVNWDDLHVGKVIGEGSYAQLRTGTYLGEPVAVKVLKHQQSNGGGSEQMDLLSDSFRELQHETFVMKNLKNPFLVELKAICTLPLAMVVDYFPLGSLDRHLRDESVAHPCLSWKYRVRLALNIARGMDYLHSEDFIHRDLRSPNILIASRDESEDIVAKVADFGLAVICAKELKGGDFNECWTAPEILAASAYNSKVDQYSYAIVLWELLELGHPFKEYEAKFGNLPRLDFFDAIIGGLRPSFPESCPQDYQNLVKSCWATDPEDRPSFGRIAEMLEKMEPSAAEWDNGNLSATTSTPVTARAMLRKKSKGSNLNMRLKQGSLIDINLEDLVKAPQTESNAGRT